MWRCLTEPAELAQFWGPREMTAPLDGIVIELRIGGRFETLMLGQHGSHRMVATFTEVVIHQRHVPEPMRWVAPTYDGLADLLATAPAETWGAPSLCEKWQVRHVVAHVTMPVRLTSEQFGAEMAAAGGNVTLLSDTVAARDASLPVTAHLAHLRSPHCCTGGSRRAAARPVRSATP